MSRILSYVINLEGSTERLSSTMDEAAKVGLKPQRIEAFDGRMLNPLEHSNYDDTRCRRYMGRSMSGGEIGCIESHFRAVQAFLDTDADFCLIFEDDISIPEDHINDMLSVLDLATLRSLPDFDVLNLGPAKPKILTEIQKLNTSAICNGWYFPMLGHALLWSRIGAENFFVYRNSYFAPTDNLLRYTLSRSGKGLTVSPSLILAGKFDSDIDSVDSLTRYRKRDRYARFRKHRRLVVDKVHAYKNQLLNC